jgi:hypothetical protein
MKTLMMLILTLTLPCLARAANCTYELDTQSVKVSWTAFKTTAKTPVGGSFTSVEVSAKSKKKKILGDLLNGVHAAIAVKDAKSLSTGNPTRDQTLFDHFFSKFKNATIDGSVKNAKGSGTEGDLKLNVKMNGKTVAVPLHYTLATDGNFEAKGSLDILDFALQAPFDELHQNCEVLHKGADGVSKTWSTVDLKLTAMIAQKCDS